MIEEDDNNKLLYSRLDDKIKLSKTKSKILYTDFLNNAQINKVNKYLAKIKFKDYIFFGGFENAERKICIIYPEKFSEDMIEKNYEKIFSVIRINLPNENKGKYTHKEYLGGMMKLGIDRRKVGDIIVDDIGADIVIFKENENYFLNELKSLIRFRKSIIELISIKDIREKIENFDEFSVIVSSMRLDNFVAELVRTSRVKATEFIEEGRVLVNYEEIYKASKAIKEKDILTIRGKRKIYCRKYRKNY